MTGGPGEPRTARTGPSEPAGPRPIRRVVASADTRSHLLHPPRQPKGNSDEAHPARMLVTLTISGGLRANSAIAANALAGQNHT